MTRRRLPFGLIDLATRRAVGVGPDVRPAGPVKLGVRVPVSTDFAALCWTYWPVQWTGVLPVVLPHVDKTATQGGS